jgi:hypothetical protein
VESNPRISDDVCRIDTVESNPRIAAVVLNHLQEASDMHAMVAVSVGFITTKPMAGKFFFGCQADNLVWTLSSDIVLNNGVPILRFDDEPPDPGESIVQMQDYDRSVKADEDVDMPLEEFLPSDNTQVLHVQPLSVMHETAGDSL